MVNNLKRLINEISRDIKDGVHSKRYIIENTLAYDDVMMFGKEIVKVDNRIVFFCMQRKGDYPLKPTDDNIVFCRMTTCGHDEDYSIHICIYEEEIVDGFS